MHLSNLLIDTGLLNNCNQALSQAHKPHKQAGAILLTAKLQISHPSY